MPKQRQKCRAEQLLSCSFVFVFLFPFLFLFLSFSFPFVARRSALTLMLSLVDPTLPPTAATGTVANGTDPTGSNMTEPSTPVFVPTTPECTSDTCQAGPCHRSAICSGASGCVKTNKADGSRCKDADDFPGDCQAVSQLEPLDT